MHKSPDYVWQKMLAAVTALCGSGKWSQRLSGAGLALSSLNGDDLAAELGEDLRFVLGWTAHNLDGGRVKSLPGALNRQKLIEKMLRILLETDRIVYSD